jgi:ATP-dependent protease Clp ATPase subunit
MLRRLLRNFANTATKTQSEQASTKAIIRAKDFKFSKDTQVGINEESTPKMIHEYLEKHVVGQEDSKKALAIAYSKNSPSNKLFECVGLTRAM